MAWLDDDSGFKIDWEEHIQSRLKAMPIYWKWDCMQCGLNHTQYVVVRVLHFKMFETPFLSIHMCYWLWLRMCTIQITSQYVVVRVLQSMMFETPFLSIHMRSWLWLRMCTKQITSSACHLWDYTWNWRTYIKKIQQCSWHRLVGIPPAYFEFFWQILTTLGIFENRGIFWIFEKFDVFEKWKHENRIFFEFSSVRRWR